jgi:translocator protein
MDHRTPLKLGLTLYYAQLGLNLAWSPLFFNTQQVCQSLFKLSRSAVITSSQITLALVDSIALAGTAYTMTVSELGHLQDAIEADMVTYQAVLDGPTDHRTTWFLLPYCGWLTLATYLNAGIWWLNIGRPYLYQKKD